MKKINISSNVSKRNYVAMTRGTRHAKELEHCIAQCSGFVKMMTGVANNAALQIMVDCVDRIGNVRSADDYAVRPCQPLVGSLHNKYRLSLLNRNVSDPELVAYGMVGASVLELSVSIWETAMRSIYKACEGMLTIEQIKRVYRQFSLIKVSKTWNHALAELEPAVANYNIDDAKERNVALGVRQLEELWVNPEIPFNATIHAVEDYQDEVFATTGNAKKSINELVVMRNEAVQELKDEVKTRQ